MFHIPGRHQVAYQRPLPDDRAEGVSHRFVEHLIETVPDVWPLAVPDSFDQQATQRRIREGLPQHVEHLPAERTTLLVQLVEQPPEDLPFPRILGDQVPQMTDLALADAVNPSE